jgi:DNA-binding transcriptional LysR family regulator
MDRIDAFRLFTAVAELESFTRAADRLGLTPGAASKQIAALEDHEQARLLERTTRSVRLTDAGRALLDRVRPWIAEYEAIENGLVADQAAAAGVLRISAPVDFGANRLVEPVTAFLERWPHVEVRLELRGTWKTASSSGLSVRCTDIRFCSGGKPSPFQRDTA